MIFNISNDVFYPSNVLILTELNSDYDQDALSARNLNNVFNNDNPVVSSDQTNDPILLADDTPYYTLKVLRAKNLNKIIIAHININSIRN